MRMMRGVGSRRGVCCRLVLLSISSLLGMAAFSPPTIPQDQFWCDVAGPIATACSSANWTMLNHTDVEICAGINTVFPLMNCSRAYPAPEMDEPMSVLLLLEFSKMQLQSPEHLAVVDLQQTFCQDLPELYNANCLTTAFSPICTSIRASFKERCREDTQNAQYSDLSLEDTLELATALLIYFIVAGVLQYTKFCYLPEAGAAILIGLGCGGAVYAIHGHFHCEFDDAFFFDILLPFIILEAGLCVDKRMFASNIGTILAYASAGTLFSCFTVGGLVYGGSQLTGDRLPLLECLIFGTLISSIDPIATLSVFSSFGVENSLYILVFGESMLNDGVAVVLFQGLVGLVGKDIDHTAIVKLFIDFVVCVVGSVACAVFTAFISSYLFKRCWGKVVSHDGEVLLFIIAALVPYYICERAGWSGIVGIMTTGVLMDVYTIKNLSPSARTSVHSFIQLASTIANAIIFLYMGMQIFGNNGKIKYLGSLGVIAVVACLIGRLWVFPVSALCNRFRHSNYPVSLAHQTVVFYSGMRGVVSYALATSIPGYEFITDEGSKYRSNVLGLTVIVILAKTFILGGFTLPVLKLLKIKMGDEAEQEAKATKRVIENSIHTAGSETPSGGVSQLTEVTDQSFFKVDEHGNLEPRHWIHTKYLAPFLLVGKDWHEEWTIDPKSQNPNDLGRASVTSIDLEGGSKGCCSPDARQVDDRPSHFTNVTEQEDFEVYRRRPVGHRSTNQRRRWASTVGWHNQMSCSEPQGRAEHHGMTFDESLLSGCHYHYESQQRYSLQ